MEIYVSLSHEIRVGRQDSNQVVVPETTDGQKRAVDQQEKERIVEEYGIDTPQEEIDEKEKERIEREEEKRDENKTKAPEDLGQRKPESELTGSEIQDQHDNLTKI
ncbi:hypothetical protein pEaSNUABM30_00234 [Erwinia phage pEa_SNUABM_30]|uniref:Uncharacterized protein n=1 Tax=Erwinia phage pEa_SNUABM_30 TaxID=2869553 RepID=A0AAE8XM56_9CAUD|nr:hypothetical protein MPK69_gp234 [Erwinia phage pEa_SNUABM_30]UAW53352.1 hypothetical protein pEaSNUABM30_00234 [Erwinia phage pEa_SNUABM_30]